MYSRAADGSGERATLLRGQRFMVPFSWTPDGQFLSFVEVASFDPFLMDIWTVSPAGDRVPYLETPVTEGNPDLSPNGQWMAYQTLESSRPEVYLERYPEPGERVTVSTDGGRGPLWSPDGSELFYRNLTGDRMMVVTVSTEPTLRVSRPEVLFEGRYALDPGGIHNYDVSADGQRFLMISMGYGELILVENWFEELKRLVPVP